jgi:hypothetical protein
LQLKTLLIPLDEEPRLVDMKHLPQVMDARLAKSIADGHVPGDLEEAYMHLYDNEYADVMQTSSWNLLLAETPDCKAKEMYATFGGRSWAMLIDGNMSYLGDAHEPPLSRLAHETKFLGADNGYPPGAQAWKGLPWNKNLDNKVRGPVVVVFRAAGCFDDVQVPVDAPAEALTLFHEFKSTLIGGILRRYAAAGLV